MAKNGLAGGLLHAFIWITGVGAILGLTFGAYSGCRNKTTWDRLKIVESGGTISLCIDDQNFDLETLNEAKGCPHAAHQLFPQEPSSWRLRWVGRFFDLAARVTEKDESRTPLQWLHAASVMVLRDCSAKSVPDPLSSLVANVNDEEQWDFLYLVQCGDRQEWCKSRNLASEALQDIIKHRDLSKDAGRRLQTAILRAIASRNKIIRDKDYVSRGPDGDPCKPIDW